MSTSKQPYPANAPMSDYEWEYRVRALRMRPRFRRRVSVAPDEVVTRFEECVQSKDCPFVIHFHDHQVEITVPKARQHFWSPYLNLLIEPTDEGAELDGRFGPNVSVWTMFVAAYAVLGISGGVGVLMGFSQISLKQQTSGFWVAGGCMLGIALVYAVAMFGQRLAGEQMGEIRGFVEERFPETT
ncbi:ABC transporter ATP-binding protein [Persicimonas caeni]|uniref:ABC transporter ATP-binding protein n=1 Tax=Persicimonas caeni TaxID=2292766 RepID=A0A4Y6PZ11_PERCE|nr:ABC transporter ATP-binding protein [Persicimonas caeni]QDG53566.1 ABC transporter ATP-binding protein [Persicimonas caeni]QED34787.1 ABC transporter ATP-binding protein [Persicimonas caeni]